LKKEHQARAGDTYFIDGATGETLYTNIIWSGNPAIGTFNSDEVPDVCISSFEDIYFIDGITGKTLYNNSDPEGTVRALAS